MLGRLDGQARVLPCLRGRRLIAEAVIDGCEFVVHRTEGIEHAWIKVFRACTPITVKHDVTGLGVAKGRLIGPRTAQRVVLVYQHHNASGEWDLLALESARVTAAVPVLMMCEGNLSRHLQEWGDGALQQAGADRRVRFDDLPLCLIQGPPLVQYRIRHTDLANVVHGRSGSDALHVDFAQTEIESQRLRIVAQTRQ